MKRPRGILSRALISALTVWLGVVLSEPLPIDACPMHDAHSMHSAAQHHSMHTGQHHGADRSGQSASHQCTCIGDCSVASGMAPASAGRTGPDAVVIFRAPASYAFSSDAPRAATRHLRPFAHAPPSSSVA